MRHVSFALAWCVAASVATAAPPQVPQTLTAKSGKLLRVVVKTEAEIGTAKNFTEEQAFWGELIAPKGERHFVFQGPTDNETDLAFVVAWWTVGEKEGVTTTITVPGVKKPTPPVVDPVKPDPPTPTPAKAEKVIVVVVEETLSRTVKQGEQLAALQEWADAGKHGRFTVDKDDPTAARNGYLAALKEKDVSLPGVIVFDAKGGNKPLTVLKLDGDTLNKVKEVVK